MMLENDSLLLQPTKHSDLDFVINTESAEENAAFVLPYSPERHRQVISSWEEEHWVIVEKAQQQKNGFMILAKDHQNKSLEFRRLVVSRKGQGIGRQCLQLIKKYCFEHLQYHRLWLDVFDFNSRAIHLYKSEGFVEEGKLVECLYRNGQFHNLLILSMLRLEY